MVGLNVQPIRSTTLIGKLLYAWEKMWLEIRMNVKKGNTLLSLRGAAFAVKGDLVKQLIIPQSIHQIAEFVYHTIKKRGLSFQFASDASVYYRQPETFADYVSALSRGDNQDIAEFKKIFGTAIFKEYEIPREQKSSWRCSLFRYALRKQCQRQEFFLQRPRPRGRE
jgi:hypothetical protein